MDKGKLASDMDVLVSIVVPIFNKEKELERCLLSLREQTYKNLEIILVDDGSTDTSLKICETIRALDGRIKVIHKNNGGVSMARNKGIELSQGKWIMFVDPDDVLMHNAVEILLDAGEEEPDVISGCLSTYTRTNPNTICDYAELEQNSEKNSFYGEDTIFCDDDCECDFVRNIEKKYLYLEVINENYGSSKCRMIGIGTPCAKLYNRVFLQKNELYFFEDLRRMQDNVFNMYVFGKAHKVVYVDKSLYIYDLSHKKSFQRVYDEKAKVYYNKVLRCRYDFLKGEDILDDEFYNEFCAGAVEVISAILKHEFLHPSNPKKMTEISKEMKVFFGDEFYKGIISNRHIGRVRPVMGIRAWMLRHRLYKGLIFLERLIYFIKRVNVQ